MSAMETLRRMLDERGVEYESVSDTCTYVGETQLTEYEPGIIGLQMRNLTPEKAIAATLGEQPVKSGADALSRRARDMARSIQGNLGRCLYRRKDVAEMEEVSETLMELANALDATAGGDNRVAERLREIAADMRGIGASSMTPRELFAYWAQEVEKAADLADFLVSMNPDGLPVGLTINEDGSMLNWRGENYVRQSALDGGKLTAEQVEKAIHDCSSYASYDGVKYYASGIRLQAIADELNATLGGGECEAIHDKGYYKGIHGYCEGLKCSNCGEPLFSEFGFCPWCGARIRKAAEQ